MLTTVPARFAGILRSLRPSARKDLVVAVLPYLRAKNEAKTHFAAARMQGAFLTATLAEVDRKFAAARKLCLRCIRYNPISLIWYF